MQNVFSVWKTRRHALHLLYHASLSYSAPLALFWREIISYFTSSKCQSQNEKRSAANLEITLSLSRWLTFSTINGHGGLTEVVFISSCLINADEWLSKITPGLGFPWHALSNAWKLRMFRTAFVGVTWRYLMVNSDTAGLNVINVGWATICDASMHFATRFHTKAFRFLHEYPLDLLKTDAKYNPFPPIVWLL